jgi:hypothetical protein
MGKSRNLNRRPEIPKVTIAALRAGIERVWLDRIYRIKNRIYM